MGRQAIRTRKNANADARGATQINRAQLANLMRGGTGKPAASVDDDRARQAAQRERANARRRERTAYRRENGG